MKLKKGDRVKVIAGKDKGKIGKIIAADPRAEKVTVEGVNVITKHVASRQNQNGQETGGRITVEAPIHASNVQLVVTVDGKKDVVTRVGYERREVTKKRPDGTEYTATRSVRIAKKTGKEI